MHSYLLCCKQIKGSHTGEKNCFEYENLLEEYDIEQKIYKAVTDNGSNMVKAFKLTLEELNEDESSDNSEEEDEPTPESIDDKMIMPSLSATDGIKCFAHTLQLTVKDGIHSSKQVISILAKVSKLVSFIKRSTSAMEKLEQRGYFEK